MTTNRTVKRLQKTAMILMLGMLLTGSASRKAADSTSSRQISVKVDGLSCPFCAYGLEKRLKKIEGTKKVIIYIDKGQAILRLKDDAPLDTRAVMEAVKKGGFTPRKITITAVGKVNKENERWVFHPKGTNDVFLLSENNELKNIYRSKNLNKDILLTGATLSEKLQGHGKHPEILEIQDHHVIDQ